MDREEILLIVEAVVLFADNVPIWDVETLIPKKLARKGAEIYQTLKREVLE